MTNQKVIFIFIDGVGLAGPDKNNPFTGIHLPFLSHLIGGPLLINHTKNEKELVFKGIDACLGVQGFPQSATGQTTLFTGINAAQHLGYHYPAFPNEPLIELINENALLKRVIESGLRATFANAYTSQYFELVKSGRYQHSATTLSVLAAGIPFRMLEDLKNGMAVYWDITNQTLRERNIPVQLYTPEQAGKNLVHIAHTHDLVLFETFATDIIGHKKSFKLAKDFLITFDSFISAIFAHKDNNTNIVITSDHGNIEDLGSGSHTKNPAILIAAGPKAHYFQKAQDLTDISRIIMEIL
ncbi:MAG: alkaline phosphatase family protein [Spirochaetales bacterium]|nr:alkaline phosphatase family protein [Spirochaetales bacterium]